MSRKASLLALVLPFFALQRNIYFVECQTVPQCALTCVSTANLGGCSSTDNKCLCTSSTFLNSIMTCFQATCQGTNITDSLDFAQQTCDAVGISIQGIDSTTVASTPTVTLSTDSPVTEPFTRTIVTVALSPSPSGDATQSTVESSTARMGTSVTPILAGVLSSTGVIAVAAITGVCCLRRHRLQRAKTMSQAAIVPTVTMRHYVVPTSTIGGNPEGQPSDSISNPTETEEDNRQRSASSYSIAKPEVGSKSEEAGDEAVPSMRQVTEIREEVARLRQLLVGSQQLQSSSSPIPDQTAQLSEMREEMQRLRHLVSLQPADRQNIFDGVSRTTSLPAYEDWSESHVA